jgi:hypothetical protein
LAGSEGMVGEEGAGVLWPEGLFARLVERPGADRFLSSARFMFMAATTNRRWRALRGEPR